jgi:hypothetical protein
LGDGAKAAVFCGVRRFLCSDAAGIVVHGDQTSITSSGRQEPAIHSHKPP